jgi:hypothetical protein
MGYRSDSPTKQQYGGLSQRHLQPKAPEVLLSWARRREYWDRAIRYLKLARFASDPNVRGRFIAIARHYRALAEAKERNCRADRHQVAVGAKFAIER